MTRRRVGGDEALHLLQHRAARRQRCALAAKLHLAPGPLKEHDELARHFHGGVAPQILLHKRQRQVEASGDARGASASTVIEG